MKPPSSTGEEQWLLLDPLLSSLLDLTFVLDGKLPPLTVGGGFGLYLKRQHLQRTGERTVLPPEAWPRIRSTNDLDLFLRVEVLADLAQVRILADALAELGYQAVKGAEYMQFVKTVERAGFPQEVKVDLLVGPPGQLRKKFQITEPRVRPKRQAKGGSDSPRLHAHHTPEAVGIDENPLPISLEGSRSTDEVYRGVVCLPQAFPYILMKLFAYHDRKNDSDPRKDRGRHHTLDLYGIVAMMTEPEYAFANDLYARHKNDDKVKEAAEIIREDFGGPTTAGVLALREHSLFTPQIDVETFLTVLHEILPTTP